MKQLILSITLLAISVATFAQSAEIEGIRKREFKGVTAIYNEADQTVSGYYTFYVEERQGKESQFIVAILDGDMNMVKQTPIVMTKRSRIDGSCFNGENFLFVFNDFVKKTLTYVTVSKAGEIIKTQGVAEEKRYATTADVFAGEDGFFIVKPVKEKKWGYSIEKVDVELNAIWEKKFLVEKGFLSVESVKSANGRVVMVQSHKEKMLSAKVKGDVIALDDKTGDELYQYSLYQGDKTLVPSTFNIDADMSVVCGGMYFDGEKWKTGNSDGVFFLKLSPEGKELSLNTEDWKEGIQKVLKTASKTVTAKPKVLFHSIVQDADGNYQVVGETFKKNLKIVPGKLLNAQKVKDLVTGRWIGDMGDHEPGDYMASFTIMDFVIFNYSAAGEMTNINIIEKPETKLTVYQPYSTMGGLRLALLVREFGFFDYAFTKQGSDGQQYVIASHFIKKGPYVGITSIEPGKTSETRHLEMDRKTVKGGGIGVMPGNGKNFGMYIYDAKAKSLLLYLEDSGIE